MKKIGFVFGTICIVVLLAALFFLPRDRDQQVEQFLPAETTFFVRQSNFKPLIDQFSVSQLGRAIGDIDYLQVARNLELRQEEIDNIKQLIATIENTIDHPVFIELFGSEFYISLLPLNPLSEEFPLEEAVKSSLMIIAKPQHSTKILQSLVQLIPSSSKEVVQYQGQDITGFSLDDRNILHTTVQGDYVLVSLSAERIKLAIDFMESNSPSLAETKTFSKYNAESLIYPHFTYLNTKQLVKSGMVIADFYIPESIDEISSELKSYEMYNNFILTSWQNEEKTIESKLTIVLDSQKKETPLGRILYTQPEINQTYQKVPGDLLAYYWINTFHLTEIIEYAMGESDEAGKQRQTLEQEVQKNLGISLDQLLNLFGPQFTAVFKESESQAFLPLPDFAFYFQLNNPEKLNYILEKFLADNSISVRKKMYEGVALTFWGDAAMNILQPVYGLRENTFLFASSESFIEEVIDQLSESSGVLTAPRIKQVTDTFSLPSNGLCYIDSAGFIRLLKEVISWGGTVLAIQDREAAGRSKILIDQLVEPILDGATMFSAVSYRSYLENDTIVVETTTLIEDE